MINKLQPALNWRKGTIQPGCFGSSWKGHGSWNFCITLGSAHHCSKCSSVWGQVAQPPSPHLHGSMWSFLLKLFCHPVPPWEASVGGAGVLQSNACCLQRALPCIYFLNNLFPEYSSGIIQLDPCLVETSVWTWGKGLKINYSKVFWWEECHRQKRKNTPETWGAERTACSAERKLSQFQGLSSNFLEIL